MKKLLIILALFSLLAIVIAACRDRGASSSADGPNGQSITVINDVGTPHVIANGTWDNSNPKPLKEQGAPVVNVNLPGTETKIIGPFNTAGVFHLYCTIHPNMNLTITVQG